jgi:hypothetical protein
MVFHESAHPCREKHRSSSTVQVGMIHYLRIWIGRIIFYSIVEKFCPIFVRRAPSFWGTDEPSWSIGRRRLSPPQTADSDADSIISSEMRKYLCILRIFFCFDLRYHIMTRINVNPPWS